MWMLLPLLALASSTASVDAEATTVLTAIIAEKLADEPTLDVLTSQDVRRIIELEAEKQALGCSADSCLAEVAGALGARFAVYGDVGRLGQSLNLTVGVFDAELGRVARRITFTGKDADTLRADLEGRAQKLVEGVLVARGEKPKVGDRTRVVILDVRVAGQTGAAPADASAAPPVTESASSSGSVLPVVGGVVAGVGLVVVGAGVFFGITADGHNTVATDKSITQREAAASIANRQAAADMANLLYLSGAVVTLGGAGLLAFGLLGSGE